MSPEQSPVAHVEHLARDRDGHVVTEEQAWSALWALLIGFFMILVDTSIRRYVDRHDRSAGDHPRAQRQPQPRGVDHECVPTHLRCPAADYRTHG